MGEKKEVVIEEKAVNGLLERIEGVIQKLRGRFSPDYHIEDITVGIEIGLPTGVKGIVQVTLKKKQKATTTA